MSEYMSKPWGIQRELSEIREALSNYLYRCRREGTNGRWGYLALRELSNLCALGAPAAVRPVLPGDSIREMAQAAAVLTAAAGKLFFTELKGVFPRRPVYLDTAALRTALFNLVSNACRHGDGAARLTVYAGPKRCILLLENRGAPPAFHGLGVAAAMACAARMGGGLRYLWCNQRVYAGLAFPLIPAGDGTGCEIPSAADYLADPFSPAYVGLADLGQIPGCTDGPKGIY